MAIKHNYVSAKADPTDSTIIGKTKWNADHTIEDATITEAKLSLSDVATADASTDEHGLLPKLSGTATEFMSGDGTWRTPSLTGLVNADISATAEIAVSKLADGAAYQTLRTASNGTTVEWGHGIHVGTTAPASPATNDIWIDTTPP